MSGKIASTSVIGKLLAAKPKEEGAESSGIGLDKEVQEAHFKCLEEAGRMLRRIEAGNSRRGNRRNELKGFEYAGREVVTDKKNQIKYWIYLFKDKDEKVKSVIVSKKTGQFVVRKGKGTSAEIIDKAKGKLSGVQAKKVVCKAPKARTTLDDVDPANPFGQSDLDEGNFKALEEMDPLR